MQKVYIVVVDNGLGYDDHQIGIIGVTDDEEHAHRTAQEWLKRFLPAGHDLKVEGAGETATYTIPKIIDPVDRFPNPYAGVYTHVVSFQLGEMTPYTTTLPMWYGINLSCLNFSS